MRTTMDRKIPMARLLWGSVFPTCTPHPSLVKDEFGSLTSLQSFPLRKCPKILTQSIPLNGAFSRNNLIDGHRITRSQYLFPTSPVSPFIKETHPFFRNLLQPVFTATCERFLRVVQDFLTLSINLVSSSSGTSAQQKQFSSFTPPHTRFSCRGLCGERRQTWRELAIGGPTFIACLNTNTRRK